jgi:tetratricopeptide (TPR) repeat protein
MSAACCEPRVEIDPAWKLFAFKDAKSDGNEEFEEGNFVAALYFYSLALAVLGDANDENLSDRCVLLSNRSQAYLKLLDGPKALENADAALKLDPTHAKSQARREAADEIIQKKRKPLTELQTEDDGVMSILPLERWAGPNWNGLADLIDASSAPSDDAVGQRFFQLASKSRERRQAQKSSSESSKK